MQLDRSLRDGQPQSDAARPRVASVIDTEEGLRDPWKERFRNAPARIPDAHDGHRLMGFSAKLDLGAFGRIPDSVSNHILQGTPQELRIAVEGRDNLLISQDPTARASASSAQLCTTS